MSLVALLPASRALKLKIKKSDEAPGLEIPPNYKLLQGWEAYDLLLIDIRNMDDKERKEYGETKAKERAEIQKKIQTLNEQRKKYVAVEMKKQQKGGKTLGSAVIQAVREQAKKKNFKFEPPKKSRKTALEKGD